jgi:hypothetical protein
MKKNASIIYLVSIIKMDRENEKRAWLEKGREMGRAKKLSKIVKGLLENGAPIDVISKWIGLPQIDVKMLKS